MTIELAVFDLAGTTVNDPDGVNQCLRGALQSSGVDVPRDAVNAVMGLPKPESIRRLLDGAGRADLYRAIPAIHDDFVARMIEFYRHDESVFEIPGTTEVFTWLRDAGIRVAVNTGFFRDVTDVLLQRLGWSEAGLIQASVASDEVPRGRPYPDMIHRLMAMLGVSDPKRVLKAGDTPADLQEGTAAGCGWVVGVLSGTHTRDQLAAHPHTHLLESIRDLKKGTFYFLEK